MFLLDELLNFFLKEKQTKYNGSKRNEVENENRWPFIWRASQGAPGGYTLSGHCGRSNNQIWTKSLKKVMKYQVKHVKQPNMREGCMHCLDIYHLLMSDLPKKEETQRATFETTRKLKCPSNSILMGNSRSLIAAKHHMWGSPVHAPYSCSAGFWLRLPSLS